MDFNKITSDLTYLGSTIREVRVNNHFVTLGTDVVKEFGFDFEITDIETNESERTGRILMQITVFLSFAEGEKSEKNDKSEFTIILEGAFTVPISISEEEFIKLLSINGSTALYSIARAKLETISAVTFMNGKLILPMVNIFTFLHEKAETSSEANEGLDTGNS
jgi:hypothetical protein